MNRMGPLCTVGVWAVLAALASTAARAQGTSYQLRIVTHAQLVPKDRKVGMSAWGVLPDAMNHRPMRGLLLCGPVYKQEKRWVEFMAGGLVSSREPASFELDARYSDRSLKPTNAFVEAEYNFRTRELSIFPSATVPIRIDRMQLGIGAESDFVFAPHNRLAVIGPRVAVPLPICRRLCKDCSLITAYRFQSDGRRVVRQYVAFNF